MNLPWDNGNFRSDKPRVSLFERYEKATRKPYVENGTHISDRPWTAVEKSSGSTASLRGVLEKIYEGGTASLLEASAALLEYRHLQDRLKELEKSTGSMKVKQISSKIDTLELPSDDNNKVIGGKNEGYLNRMHTENSIERREKFVGQLQRRLMELKSASKTRLRPSSDILVSDLAPPSRIIDGFCDLYSKEWSAAFQELKTTLDEGEALWTLFRVIQDAYIFCCETAEYQRATVEGLSDKLQETLLHPSYIHPVSKQMFRATAAVDDKTRRHIEVGQNMILQYRNVLVTKSVPGMQEMFRKVKLSELMEIDSQTTTVKQFVDKLVELIWLMVVQDPPMVVYWLEPDRTVIGEYFDFYDRKGRFVVTTVWPAIFIKHGGDLLSKGVVKAKP